MVCKNCGADDLLVTDLCGDYCIYCLNFELIDKVYKDVPKKVQGNDKEI